MEAKAFVAMRYWHPFSDEAARGGESIWPGPNRAFAALSAIFHHHQRVVLAGLGAGGAERQACRARIAGLLLSWRCRFYRRGGGENPRRDGRDPRRIFPIACCCRRMACPSARSQRAIPINGRWSKPRRGPCGCAGDDPDLDRWSAIRAGWARWNGSGPPPMRKSGAPGADGKGVIVAPIAFVSEHSETLVELDIEYRQACAREPACRIIAAPRRWAPHPAFIAGLGRPGATGAWQGETVTCGDGRICPAAHQSAAAIGRRMMDSAAQ